MNNSHPLPEASPAPSAAAWLKRALGLVFLGVSCAAASQFPYYPVAAVALVLGYVVVLAVWPAAWLLVLPALLPVLDFAPWTGWLLIDEFDILALASVAGALLFGHYGGTRSRLPTATRAIIAFWTLVTVLTMLRGLEPLTPPNLSAWFATYTSPYNAVRVAKGPLLALLLLPSWLHLQENDGERANRYLILGLAIGMIFFGLSILWERGVLDALFQFDKWGTINNLLDFSSSHRAVALMSQMHTGGSAIDGYLTVALPIIIAGLLYTHQRTLFTLVLTTSAGLGAYSVAVTFTRATYAASAASLLVILWTGLKYSGARRTPTAAAAFLIVLVAYLALLFAGFRAGGVFAVFYAGVGFMLGVVIENYRQRLSSPLYLVALTAATALIAVGVGDAIAHSRWAATGQTTLIALALLTGALSVACGGLAWTFSTGASMNARLLLIAVLGAAVPAAMLATGGYRMQTRFDTAVKDITHRTAHWKNVLALLGDDKTTWATGIGLGAFPRHFIFLSPPAERVGTYAYQTQGENGILVLGGGRDLALGQRIRQPPPEIRSLTFSGRSRWREEAAGLGASVCRRRLLEQEAYNGSCSYVRAHPGTSEGVWTPFRIQVDISNLGRNAHFTPRFPLLRIGNRQPGALLEVDDLRLTDAYGSDYLRNGSFETGGTGWYSYNDFEHLAWHPKNLALAVLVEQGLVGAAAFAGLLLLSLRNARHLARVNIPIAIGSLAMTAGILVLGAFATVIDVPRVAFLVYLVLLVGATTYKPAAAALPDSRGRKKLANFKP